jgi:hemerythrin-like domain-containing protein
MKLMGVSSMIGDLFQQAPAFDDPLGMLRACHRRIERALDVTERVAAMERAGPLHDAACEALRQTLHYFATGVPRHSADEDESLFPRLRAAGSDVLHAAEHLSEEHAELDALHRELDSLAQELLARQAFESGAARERFGEVVGRLRGIYNEHIRREDEEVFPAAKSALAEEELDAVGAEMAARRGIDWSRHRAVLAELEARPWLTRGGR